jgi:prepilin-type N-terminal cleavage/methylation domain-containing protein
MISMQNPLLNKQNFLLSKMRGFTLIELLVVISVITLLSSIILSSLNAARLKADESKVLSQYNQLRIALELYQSDNGGYPAPGIPSVTYCIGLCKYGGLTPIPLNTALASAGKPLLNYVPDTKRLSWNTTESNPFYTTAHAYVAGDYGFVYRIDALAKPDRVIFTSQKSASSVKSAKIGVWTLSTGSN